MDTYCCPRMKDALTGWACPEHESPFDCPDAILHQLDSGFIGIVVHDGGGSIITIDFCPWCGQNPSRGSQERVPVEDANEDTPNCYGKLFSRYETACVSSCVLAQTCRPLSRNFAEGEARANLLQVERIFSRRMRETEEGEDHEQEKA